VEEREDLRRRVEALSWVHRIDLGGGLVTPGAWKRSALVERALDRLDLSGKSVLDIGCWDGLWSFEAERRGAASVLAVDDLSQRSLDDQPTFRLAHEALGSRVEYLGDLDVHRAAERLAGRTFDVVLFLGVYYHLKHPLLALSNLRRLTRPGGVLLTEGPVRPGRRARADFFHSRTHKDDPSTWFLPTLPCLREWIECSYFEVEEVLRPPWPRRLGPLLALKDGARRLLGSASLSTWRCVVRARAVERDDVRYAFPDPDLAAFDRRRYASGRPLSRPPGR
jgi:tRNA (mo5U34)-methyltransferase